jgi:hypothetical protein
MKLRHWMFRIVGLIASLWFFSPVASAGDCTGPGDCTAPRDNAPKAAGGTAVVTAIALALRGNGNGDEEETSGEASGVDDDSL